MLAGLIGLWVVYLGLIGLDIYLLSVTARAGVHHVPERPDRRRPAAELRRRRGFRGRGSTDGESYDDLARHEPRSTLWFWLIALTFTLYFFLEGFDFGVDMPAAAAGPDRGRGARADRHDRTVLGRQRGVGAGGGRA